MRESLSKFLSNIDCENILNYNEESAKQTLVLPILQLLGWNIFDINEVHPEYSIYSKRVDYLLKNKLDNKVFVEVKRPGTQLDKHQEQLLNYSFQEGISLSVLTNGIIWWFYLPLREGSWEQRKFYSVDIEKQKREDVVNIFTKFLSKDNICSGKAIKNAENIFTSKNRNKKIMQTLPTAWNEIVTEPDEMLIEILSDKVENISGFTPDIEELLTFFEKNTAQILINFKSSFKHKENIDQKYNNKNILKSNKKYIKQEDLVPIIVKILKENNGRATKQVVDNKIYSMFDEQFKNHYFTEKVSHGVPRWQHNIAWAKERAKHYGYIKSASESGRGIWELTQYGFEVNLDNL